jgi:hypothetical protein
MTRTIILLPALLTLVACDSGSTAPPKTDTSAKAAATSTADAKSETKPAAAKAPDCDTVVNNIASFNAGSGDAEKKLWNKMCAEMSDAEKTCVAAAKDMDGMKACMKKDKKLEK